MSLDGHARTTVKLLPEIAIPGDGRMERAHVERWCQSVLEPDEEVRIHAWATEAILAVTSKRLVVADTRRVCLAIPFEGVRRLEFNIEQTRFAMLVIVPESARDHPQVLTFRPTDYAALADVLVAIGTALAATERHREESPVLAR